MPYSLKRMVSQQVDRVLRRGQRFDAFDQIRQRHFWSTRLFAVGAGNPIAAGAYEIFSNTPGQTGQGYPVPLTGRETNWLNANRVPDNQNFAITEIGVSVVRPPPDDGVNSPADGIFSALTAPIQALINGTRVTHPDDAASVLYGSVLEFSFLTNSVPLGLCADFSQSSGTYAQEEELRGDSVNTPNIPWMGDPSNGVPAAAFRRKLEVPILLQHGENMGMRLRFPRAATLKTLAEGGAGWLEVRVDWWATESFVEKS